MPRFFTAKFLKTWLDAAAAISGPLAGLPFEPVMAPASASERTADDGQFVLPLGDDMPYAQAA